MMISCSLTYQSVMLFYLCTAACSAQSIPFIQYAKPNTVVAFQQQYAGQRKGGSGGAECKQKQKCAQSQSQLQRRSARTNDVRNDRNNYRNSSNNSNTKRHNDAIKNFITNEKGRLEKILAYEKRRLGRLNDFLASEKTRLKNLEKQEKDSFSSMFFDDGSNVGMMGDLSSALTVIEDQWKISSRTKRRERVGTNSPGWTKLVLDPVPPYSAATTTVAGGARSDDASYGVKNPAGENDTKGEEEYVYLYEPSTSTPPSYVILFLGGAGLGQFPHISYSEMLTRISHELNASILTAPYKTGLDHYELSKETGVVLHRALAQCRDREPERYMASTPKFLLGHSLGSKLWTISTAAMSDSVISGDRQLAGVGLISFNNFGFLETTKQVKTFADAMEVKKNKKNVNSKNNSGNSRSNNTSNTNSKQVVDTILEIAEQAVSIAGLEFTPSPSTTTDRIINQKYNENLLKKTRLFVFDDDDLDSSRSFYESAKNPSDLSVSGLSGSHLAPVYIKVDLGFDDIDLNLTPEARKFAQGATGGIQNFSYGDEDLLIELVDEVCDWIRGGSPTRGPPWKNDGSSIVRRSVNNNSSKVRR